MILTQDDDFFTELQIETTAGVLFQTDQTLSAREVGDAVHELSQHIDQADITLEYVNDILRAVNGAVSPVGVSARPIPQRQDSRHD